MFSERLLGQIVVIRRYDGHWLLLLCPRQKFVQVVWETAVLLVRQIRAQRRVVTGSGDNSARVWDLPGATPVTAVLEGHRGAVGSLAFSPDGKRVATGFADNTARVWDTPPLEELIPLARKALTRCLTTAQRDELGLPVVPGAGQDREHIDPPPCPCAGAPACQRESPPYIRQAVRKHQL